MKKNKDLFTEAVSEMKHFLIGATFVLVLVAIVPAFAYPMDMSGMGGMTMPSGMSGMTMEEMQKMQSGMSMPSPMPMPSSTPSPSPSSTTQKTPCSYLGGQLATATECGEAYMKSMMHSVPAPAPAPAPAPTPPPPPPPAPVPAKKTAPKFDIEELIEDLEHEENAAKEIEELKKKATGKEVEAAKAAELKNLELEVEVKIVSKNINEKKLQRLEKLLARQKGSKSPKYIKALVKELDKSLQEWKGESCADYPTEVSQLKCEILFTDALKSIKATSQKKKPDIQELKKAISNLQSGIKAIGSPTRD